MKWQDQRGLRKDGEHTKLTVVAVAYIEDTPMRNLNELAQYTRQQSRVVRWDIQAENPPAL